MTTESRMREALEQARVYIEGVAYGMPVDPTGPILSLISEALSPTARRTEYRWVVDGITHRVRSKWGGWVIEYSAGPHEGHDTWIYDRALTTYAAAAIATLAGLTPPEEEA